MRCSGVYAAARGGRRLFLASTTILLMWRLVQTAFSLLDDRVTIWTTINKPQASGRHLPGASAPDAVHQHFCFCILFLLGRHWRPAGH